eukprot:scaffold668_cov385-Prasinococcus_capsulatus_cf.AAC.4
MGKSEGERLPPATIATARLQPPCPAGRHAHERLFAQHNNGPTAVTVAPEASPCPSPHGSPFSSLGAPLPPRHGAGSPRRGENRPTR